MAGRSADSDDFPTDYIDIVNEINDFIASLDAPPLSEHTKQLVGDQGKTGRAQQPPSPSGSGISTTSSTSFSPVANSEASGGQKTRGFDGSDHVDFDEQCAGASRLGYQRQPQDKFGYHDNVSACGSYPPQSQAPGQEDQVTSYGDYDNPAMLVGAAAVVETAQSRDVSRVAGQSGSRSRHASGEKRQVGYAGDSREGNPSSPSVGQSNFIVSGDDSDTRVRFPGAVSQESGRAQPFPSEEDLDQNLGHYDYVDSDRSRSTGFGDYSDCSSYSDTASVTSSSGGGTGDSDSGCYSHYQQPRSHAARKPSFYKDISHSLDSPPHFRSSPSSPFFSGSKGSSGGVRNPSLPWSRQQQHQRHPPIVSSSQRPQSPDRLSAEFRCDSDDLNFQKVGSSARTLTSHHHHQQQQRERAYYQQVTSPPRPLPASLHHPSPPQVPKSPVPQRRSPSRIVASRAESTPSPTDPPAFSIASLVRDASYSIIQKNVSELQASSTALEGPRKLNLKSRWPPAPVSETSDTPSPGVKPSQLKDTQAFQLSKPKPFQRSVKDNTTTSSSTQEFTGGNPQSLNSPQHQSPVNPRIPDLSVLISELRSAAAFSRSDQPSSPSSLHYKSTARSESRSQTQSPVHGPRQQAQAEARSEPQSPVSKPKFLANQGGEQQEQHHHHSPSQKFGSRSAGQSPVRPGVGADSSRLDSPARHKDPGASSLSPTRSRAGGPHTHGLRYKSASPDHDYEPIETLQLEVPATPRPQPKFPHPQGHSAMADTGGQGQTPKHVKALFPFKGSNNDELCFKKGDVITVTQCIDGGWWEGTLNGRTGWFPSNFTKEIKGDLSYKNHKSGEVPVYKRESMQLYHNMVLKNVIETEKAHVEEMTKVLQSYIKPIQATNLLSPSEYSTLIGNMEEIITFQQSFLSALEECEKLPLNQRRIGGIFMQFATSMKELHSSYCANHPKAVSLLQKRREELSKFVESQGASSPGAQALTTILSKPFVRLDKYPSLLKELERHVEESHPDRGDTQRAIAVYKNIANSCLDIRKLKEMEHEIITSAIQGWEGEEINKLGEVIHLSQVKMITQTGEKFERIFVLFPSCLVMLSMSSRLSSYQYEGKIPLSGLVATPTENPESFQNAFEISGPMIEKITVLCGTRLEVTAWLDILRHQLSQSGYTPSSTSSSSAKPQPMQMHMISTCQPSISTVTPAKTAQISLSSSSSNAANNILNNNMNNSNPAPTGPSPPHFPAGLMAKGSAGGTAIWSLTCLRPSPPLRPMLMCREEVLKSPRAARKSTHKRKPVRTFSGEEADWYSKQHDPKVYNEDAFILQVIEAYCNSIKTRHTVNSCKIDVANKKPQEGGKAVLNSPQILLAEEEKIFDESEQQERTVVDTVYALQDRVKELEQEQRRLRVDLDEERRCRRKLEVLVKQQFSKFVTCGNEADGTGGTLLDSGAVPSSHDGISSQDGGS